MSIRLQFSGCRDIASRAIMWFTHGQFSHVDVVLPSGELLGARNDSVGGKPPGVQVRPRGYTQFSKRVIMELTPTLAQEKSFYDFLMRQVGKPYDHAAIWGFLVNRDWRERDSWICSELIAATLEESSIIARLYALASTVDPVDLSLIFSAIGGRPIKDE